VLTPISRVAHSMHSTRPRNGTAQDRHAVRPHDPQRSMASRSGCVRQVSLLVDGASAPTRGFCRIDTADGPPVPCGR
jgi:hypothetical protein